MNDDLDLLSLLLKNANLPRRYQKERFANLCEHKGWAAAFDKLKTATTSLKDGKVIVLCGDRGTGKTELACQLILWAAMFNSFFCRYEVLLDYLDCVRRTNNPEAVYEHDARYLSPRILVIDEIAKAGDSAWAEQRLFHLVNTRYNDLKHTVLITAAPTEALPGLLGPSIHDRINEGGLVLHLDWPSFRTL